MADWSGQAWLNGFNEVGQMIFDMSADALMAKVSVLIWGFPALTDNSCRDRTTTTLSLTPSCTEQMAQRTTFLVAPSKIRIMLVVYYDLSGFR